MGHSVEQTIPMDKLAEFCKRNHIRRLRHMLDAAIEIQQYVQADIPPLIAAQRRLVEDTP
jgi:hypothetical protein